MMEHFKSIIFHKSRPAKKQNTYQSVNMDLEEMLFEWELSMWLCNMDRNLQVGGIPYNRKQFALPYTSPINNPSYETNIRNSIPRRDVMPTPHLVLACKLDTKLS